MLEQVLVREWMTERVVTVTPSTPVPAAYALMQEEQVRRLPVVEHGRLVGIVTLGDIREAKPSDATSLSVWEVNYLWAKLTVAQVMTRSVISIAPDAPILDAAELMLEHKVSGLPVLDAHGALLGIITESDVFKMLVRSRTKSPLAAAQ